MRLPILLYHDLDSPEFPNEKTNLAARDTVVAAADFEGQLRSLVSAGYRTTSLAEYQAQRHDPEWFKQKRVVISFDDGHHSNYHLAVPALRRHGFTATFFVVAGRIGVEHHLSAVQLREMADAGMEIGSHGLTHAYLPLLNDDGVAGELMESKRILEDVTGRMIETLAFPGGHYNRGILPAVVAAGYRAACSCLQGLNDGRTDPLLLRRIEVRRRFGDADAAGLFSPGSLLFYRSIDSVKSLFRNSLGIRRYSALRARCYRWYRFRR